MLCAQIFQVICLLNIFMMVQIITESKIKIKGSIDTPTRFAYTGDIILLSTTQSKFNANSEVDPTFSYVS